MHSFLGLHHKEEYIKPILNGILKSVFLLVCTSKAVGELFFPVVGEERAVILPICLLIKVYLTTAILEQSRIVL